MKKSILETDYTYAILHGDPTILRQMYQTIFPLITNLIRQNGGTEEDAKDIFQDAVMVIYEKARQPDFQLTSQFSTYFYGICWNLWGSRLQKKSFSEVTIPEDIKSIAGDIPDVDFTEVEKQKLFDKAFESLGEDCQRLLLLYFRKMPMDSIAREMGYASEGYARRRKFMCKEYLTELVKGYPEYAELCVSAYKKNESHGKK